MSTTAAPRFRIVGRLPSTIIGTLLRPVPGAVSAALGEKAEAHSRLAAAYGEQVGVVVAITRKLEEAERADADALRKAVASGQALPTEKAPKLREELERAERRRQALAAEVEPSANVLLEAAFEVAAPVAEACQQRAVELDAAALASLRTASEALDAASEQRSASAWASTLARGGQVAPFTHGRAAQSNGRRAIDEALRVVSEEVERRGAYRDEHEREVEKLNSVRRGVGVTVRLPDPPRGEQLDAERAARA